MTRPRLWCFPASTYHFLGEQDHRKSFAMNRETSWMKGKQFSGLAGHRCARPLARGPFVGLWQRSALASRRRCSVEFGECLVNAFCFQTRSSRVHHKSLSVAGFLYFRMSRSSGGSCARETSWMQGKQFSESASSRCAWPLARGPFGGLLPQRFERDWIGDLVEVGR